MYLLAGVLLAQAAEFEKYVPYQTGALPYQAAIGDFNGDGKPDLAIAISASHAHVKHTVSVLLGNGDGTFQDHVDYGIGNGALSIAAADFNGDGKLDLVTANLFDNAASVLLGNGDGTFQPNVEYATRRHPFSLVVGDFNADGKLDLALACGNGTGYVSVLLGNGDGTFQEYAAYPVGTAPKSIAVADFNRDGSPDLVVANGADDTVSVLLGNGDGTFHPAVDYPVGTEPESVAVGDFNRDGKADLATAIIIGGSGGVSVLLGNGDGTFQPPVDYTTSVGAFGIAAGDLDGDGNPDLVTANFVTDGIKGVSVLSGNGDGTFQPHIDFRSGSDSISVTIGDLNGDSAPDLAVVNYEGFSVGVFLNTGSKQIP
jgi:hypothetical protein